MALTGLQVDIILDSALEAFKRKLLPIRLFSIGYQRTPLAQKGDVMKVPYYPLVTAASTDFNGSYSFTDAGPGASTIDVDVNKRKYQPIITTSEELARNNWDPAKIGAAKGGKLATDVVTDVLSLVTASNFGTASFTGAASTFDSDDVADLKGVADTANWPMEQRALCIGSTYETALIKDDAIKTASAYGSSDPIVNGLLPRVHGFDVASSPHIPANSENLVGFISHPSAIAVGFAPITPAESVLRQLTAYRAVVDPETGIMIEYRAWGDPDSDSHKEVIECNYGYKLAYAAGLKRLVSA